MLRCLLNYSDYYSMIITIRLFRERGVTGNMSVTEYAAKFVELAKFYPHYTPETAEFSHYNISL